MIRHAGFFPPVLVCEAGLACQVAGIGLLVRTGPARARSGAAGAVAWVHPTTEHFCPIVGPTIARQSRTPSVSALLNDVHARRDTVDCDNLL
jgi:hypothetical protein